MLQPKAQISRNKQLGSAEIRRMLTDYVRKRVSASDVDDVVQTVLVEALSAERVPDDHTELRKWLTGVARHKIADLHRRVSREKPSELPELETSPPPVEEQQLLEWAEREAKKTSKDADATLRWMAREGEGDKLEHIAAEEQLPAATVRQRVSRMRRWMKDRWLAELAAAAAFGVLAFVLYRFLFPTTPPPEAVREEPKAVPSAIESARPVGPSPLERAAELRRSAIPLCGTDPVSCLKILDEAKRIDPVGDSAPEVEAARDRALLLNMPAPQLSNEVMPAPGPIRTAPTQTSAPVKPAPNTPFEKRAPKKPDSTGEPSQAVTPPEWGSKAKSSPKSSK